MAEQLKNHNKTVFYVRNFIAQFAQDTENDKQENVNCDPQSLINNVRKSILEDIPSGSSAELYIIDNRHPLEYDFPKL